MIIGVEHIGASDGSARGTLEALGYRPRFADTGLPNSRTKAPFLLKYGALHDIAYYEAVDDSPAVELISYGRAAPRASDPLPTLVVDRPLDEGATPSEVLADALRAGLGADPALVRVGPLASATFPIISAPTGRGPAISAYAVAVRDPEASAALWAGALGMTVDSRDPGGHWMWLRLSPPVPRWRIRVLLARDENATTARHLDEDGVTSIAFLSTDLDRDRERLARVAHVGEPFAITVHDRPLRVCVGRSPDGDLIELIQITSVR